MGKSRDGAVVYEVSDVSGQHEVLQSSIVLNGAFYEPATIVSGLDKLLLSVSMFVQRFRAWSNES